MPGPFLLELLGDLHWTFVSVGIVSSVFITGLVLWTRRAGPRTEPAAFPPISVLKPFDGLDPDMEENFWSYLSAPYPGPREVLFCTGRDNPEGLAVAERVIARLEREPQDGVTARILLPEEGEAPWVTRKVWHMARGFSQARHDVIINGDSGTRVGPGALRALVATLLRSDQVGAAWAPYAVAESAGLGARLTRVAWTATTMNFLVVDGMNRVSGLRPMLAGGLFAARREVIEELDGFAACDGFLTEDLEVGRRIHGLGWRVERAAEPVVRYLGDLDLAGFVRRQQRWNTILWTFRDPLFIPYPLTMCGLAVAPWTCLAASLAFPERTVEYVSALAALYVVRLAYALFLSASVPGGGVRLDTVTLLPLVDAIFLATWLRAPFVRTLRWRDVTLRIEPGGRVRPT
jgi:ceramide glucosyltransferase